MKKYPEMKDSGVAWIGEVPEHWGLVRGKRLFINKKIKNEGHIENNILSLTLKGVIRNNAERPIGLSPMDYSTYQIFERDDLVFKLIDLNNISTSRVGIVPERGIMSSAYIRLTAREECNIRFYYLFYTSLWHRNVYNGLGAGVRQTLDAETLLNLEIPILPLPEQDQIVRFLDWKVSEINRLISLRKKQIADLEELKKAVISRAVTKGLDPNTPMKDSGVSWIGEMPEHWVKKSLVQFAEEQQIKNVGMIENNLLSLSYGKIKNKDINTTDGLLPVSFEGYQIVYDGNIILRLTDLQNDHRSLRTGLVTQKGIITAAYTCLKVRDEILPEYLHLELHVADLRKVFYGMGGGVRQSIGFKDIRSLVIVVPPLPEQERIVAYLDEKTSKIDEAIDKKNRQIELLKELKTRLISDVVTGKIDVRDVEIPEYEYAEEELDADEARDGGEAGGEDDGDER